MTELRVHLQSTLGDAYTIQRELGGGGMSRVFVARDEALGRDVVIKVLSPELAASLSAERFTREIKLAAALQEPHIVPVHSAGLTSNGLPFYTMPFVAGDSLRARLSAGRLPIGESIGILRNIAQALTYAHGHGIIHRDIKPENVLLSSGTAVVTDFGIAKALAASKTQAPGGTLTQVGTSLGTPAYMAPEQAVGDDVGTGADLYAWGVIAYEMLAGHHPFSEKTTAQKLIAAHIAEQPRDLLEQLPPDERRDPVAKRIAALVMSCLEKQPAARPSSAGELLTTLGAVTTPSGIAHSGDGTRRSRVVIAAGALVILGGAAALFAWRRQAAPPLLEPKRVVVATFENKSGDRTLDPLGPMAADWIARGLANTGIVDVGGTSAELLARGATSRATSGASALQMLARDAKAGLVISGAYYRQGDSVLFQADFTDANAGKLIESVGPVAASVTSPLDGIERLRERVMGSLSPLVDSSLAGLAGATSKPPSMAAYREFLAGEEQFYSNEDSAVARYFRAAALDSTYLYPLMRVVGIYANRNDGRGLDSVERIVNRHRHLLTPFELGYLTFGVCRPRLQTAVCLQAARQMVAVAPRSHFAAYLLGIAERWTGHSHAADSILSGLDPEDGALRGRVYYYDHLGASLHSLGAFDRELTMARRARSAYPGRAYVCPIEIRALAALGRINDVNTRVTECLTMPADLQRTAGTISAGAVYELRAHGHTAAAAALSARLVAWLAARPAADAATPEGRLDRAEILMAAHQWNDLQLLADSLAAEKPKDMNAIRLKGVALAMRGHRAEAERLVAQTSAADQTTDPMAERRSVMFIAAALGDKARATSLTDVLGLSRDHEHATLVYELLKDYPPFIERMKPRA